MRDGEVYQQFERMASAVSADNAQLQKAVALMRTRIDALENLLLGSRLGILRMVMMQLLSPRKVAQLVQFTHSQQIKLFNAARAAAEQNQSKIKAAPVEIIKANGVSNGQH